MPAHYDEAPATAYQRRQLRVLAERLGMPGPRDDLTRAEAEVALVGLHKRLNNHGPFPAPVEDPELQPGETLRHWHPYRRTGESRGQGERLA